MASFLVDSNVMSKLLRRDADVVRRLHDEVERGSQVLLSRVVDYEVRRGLAHKPKPSAERIFDELKKRLEWAEVEPEDWEWAVRSYAEARTRGITPQDADLLIAAQSVRTGAVVVTDDADFDHLRIPRVSWG